MKLPTHAVGDSVLSRLADGTPALMSACGQWVSAHRCTEDQKADCDHCKARVRERDQPNPWDKVRR